MTEQMEAGPKLDALVAEVVLGWDRWEKPGVVGPDVYHEDSTRALERHGYVRTDKPLGEDIGGARPYSSRIVLAWEVVEKMHNTGWHVAVSDNGLGAWSCQIHENLPGGVFVLKTAATAPLAICLAALAAMEAK